MTASTIETALTFILSAGGGLSIIVALILYATGKWGDNQANGMSDARMMGCVLAAIAFFAAAALVQFIEFDPTF